MSTAPSRNPSEIRDALMKEFERVMANTNTDFQKVEFLYEIVKDGTNHIKLYKGDYRSPATYRIFLGYELGAASSFANTGAHAQGFAQAREASAKVCDALVNANLDGCNPRYVPKKCAKAIRAIQPQGDQV